MSNRLKESRIAAGLTLSKTAAELNTTTRTVIRWENGEYEPNASCLKKMASLYNVSIDHLLDLPPTSPRLDQKAGRSGKAQEKVPA